MSGLMREPKRAFSSFSVLRTGCFAACIAFSLPSSAGMGGYQPYTAPTNPHLWYVTASLGYGVYQDTYESDGETAVGRLAIGRDLFNFEPVMFGLEVGVQNGNAMRIDATQAQRDALGGLPIQTTVKPFLDALVTLKVGYEDVPVYALVKGGVAYRRLQFDLRDSIPDESEVSWEVQAGLGYCINERASLSLVYQGIYGSDPDLKVNVANETATISGIPAQHSVLLGMTLKV